MEWLEHAVGMAEQVDVVAPRAPPAVDEVVRRTRPAAREALDRSTDPEGRDPDVVSTAAASRRRSTTDSDSDATSGRAVAPRLPAGRGRLDSPRRSASTDADAPRRTGPACVSARTDAARRRRRDGKRSRRRATAVGSGGRRSTAGTARRECEPRDLAGEDRREDEREERGVAGRRAEGTCPKRRVRRRTAPWPGGPESPLTMGPERRPGDRIRPTRSAADCPEPPQLPVPAASVSAARTASWNSGAHGPAPVTTNGDVSIDSNASGSST